MKVRELIKELLEMNLDEDIIFAIEDGCCGDIEILNGINIDTEGATIIFDALWFFDTCITSGIAQTAAQAHKDKLTKS